MASEKQPSELTAAIERAESIPNGFSVERFVHDTKTVDHQFAGFRMPRDAVDRLILQAELGRAYCLQKHGTTENPDYLAAAVQLDDHLAELRRRAPWAFSSPSPDASVPREKPSCYKACHGVLGEVA